MPWWKRGNTDAPPTLSRDQEEDDVEMPEFDDPATGARSEDDMTDQQKSLLAWLDTNGVTATSQLDNLKASSEAYAQAQKQATAALRAQAKESAKFAFGDGTDAHKSACAKIDRADGDALEALADAYETKAEVVSPKAGRKAQSQATETPDVQKATDVKANASESAPAVQAVDAHLNKYVAPGGQKEKK